MRKSMVKTVTPKSSQLPLSKSRVPRLNNKKGDQLCLKTKI